MKIAHISDIHIRNFKYHDVYNKIFDSLYTRLVDLAPDIIINTGDTAHTKLQLSPAYFDMTAKFFTKLSDIAPLHIIVGNHDLNLNNLSNIDAITPIVNALQNPNIFYHKDSEVFQVRDIDFHVLSMVDPENWNLKPNPNRISVGLYHGSVAGVKTDLGWTMDHGDIEVSNLSVFDYALLGDIHKTNQALDELGKVRYPGSLIQQNHGETNDKGFLLWDIRGKNDFDVEHIKLPNPTPFISVELLEDGSLPDMDIPEGCRLRIISLSNHSSEISKKAAELAKQKYKPESIAFLNKYVNASVGKQQLLLKENLRDINVQQTLIKEYLKPFNLSENVINQVLELNKKYNTSASEYEDVSRNVNWKLKHLQWDNLFNYGEGNEINFSNLNGIVGIFGKNYSGKSSVIDSALYTLFNTTSKNDKKVSNIINQNRKSAKGVITFDIDGFEYTITRKVEKVSKKTKGQETEEAKTSLDISCFDTISGQVEKLNELSRTDTDKFITRMIGSIDDFMLTSLASQLDSLSFIKEGSTKRKEILAKFLDLDIFETKHKLAKDDSLTAKALLKKYENNDYDLQLENLNNKLDELEIYLEQLEQDKKTLAENKAVNQQSISELQAKLNNINFNSPWDFDLLVKESDNLNTKLNNIKNKVEQTSKDIEEKEQLIIKVDSFLSEFDLEELTQKKNDIASKQKELNSLHQELQLSKKEVGFLKDKVKLLTEVPCGSQFPTCKFIKDAIAANDTVGTKEETLSSLKQSVDNLANDIEALNVEQVTSQLSKYEQVKQKRSSLENEILKLKLSQQILDKDKETTLTKISEVESKIEEYKKNEEQYKTIKELQKSKKEIEDIVVQQNAKIKYLDDSIRASLQNIGSTKTSIDNTIKSKETLEQLRNEYIAYDYFMRCMHTNGISYDIIKKKLPIINDEIAKTLSNIVDFEVFFENESNKLNVLLKHTNGEPRPIEMGSGAEKTIASMAIRLALLQVSNLPKSNVIILDEPATALDAENMDGFIRMLGMIKSHYDVVILISHLDALKDIVDLIIPIDKKDGYAYVTG
jgi:DNA repair exonuclease SbcCD ATPase subunit